MTIAQQQAMLSRQASELSERQFDDDEATSPNMIRRAKSLVVLPQRASSHPLGEHLVAVPPPPMMGIRGSGYISYAAAYKIRGHYASYAPAPATTAGTRAGPPSYAAAYRARRLLLGRSLDASLDSLLGHHSLSPAAGRGTGGAEASFASVSDDRSLASITGGAGGSTRVK